MKEWIEQQIQETYESMLLAIKSDKLTQARQYQQIINELKEQLELLD